MYKIAVFLLLAVGGLRLCNTIPKGTPFSRSTSFGRKEVGFCEVHSVVVKAPIIKMKILKN